MASQADETIVDVDEAGVDNREDYAFGWNERGQRQERVNMILALCQGQLMALYFDMKIEFESMSRMLLRSDSDPMLD